MTPFPTDFSFFLAIPTLVAAGGYSLWKERALLSVADVPLFAVGFIVSFAAAWACVRWLLRYISTHTFVAFAWYRIAFGIVVLDRETETEEVAHLVRANDELPASRSEDFFTIHDNQTAADVRVMEQAGSVASTAPTDNNEIATGVISIPTGKKQGWPIEVTFTLDTSGLLHVAALEKETGERLELQVDVGGMSEEDVERSRATLSRVQVT